MIGAGADYDDYVPVIYDASGPHKDGVLYHEDGTMFYPAYTDDSKERPYDPARPPKWLKGYLEKKKKEKRKKKQSSKKKCKGRGGKCKSKGKGGGKKGRRKGKREHGSDYAEDILDDVLNYNQRDVKRRPVAKRKSNKLSIKERKQLEGDCYYLQVILVVVDHKISLKLIELLGKIEKHQQKEKDKGWVDVDM